MFEAGEAGAGRRRGGAEAGAGRSSRRRRAARRRAGACLRGAVPWPSGAGGSCSLQSRCGRRTSPIQREERIAGPGEARLLAGCGRRGSRRRGCAAEAALGACGFGFRGPGGAGPRRAGAWRASVASRPSYMSIQCVPAAGGGARRDVSRAALSVPALVLSKEKPAQHAQNACSNEEDGRSSRCGVPGRIRLFGVRGQLSTPSRPRALLGAGWQKVRRGAAA